MTGKTALNVGSDRQLFVDDYLIESMSGADLKLHSPVSAGRVLTVDMPWEGVTCDYHTVFQDGGIYRIYYRGSSHEGYTIDALLEPGEESVPVHHENVCYAESSDGTTWTRPSLGLFEFEGSKVNNIVWLDENGDTSDLVPFLDGNPDAAEDEKYKGIVWRGSRVFAVASDDAVTWRFMRDEPILTERPFDSQNVPFWDPWKGEYVIFTRGKIGSGGSFRGGYRWIRRATSPDFLNVVAPGAHRYRGHSPRAPVHQWDDNHTRGLPASTWHFRAASRRSGSRGRTRPGPVPPIQYS